MRLQPEIEHPHGLSDREFDTIFTSDRPVIFAYHGYPWMIHRLTYRRTNHDNIHVRGYKEEGTTTTPFDMLMMNDLDRFHLVMDVIDRVPSLGPAAADVRQEMVDGGRRPAPGPAKTARSSRGEGLGGRLTRTLVINAGSSSLKLSVIGPADETIADLTTSRSDPDAVRRFCQEHAPVDATGHRIVHGGTEFVAAVVLDDTVIARLETLVPLAPLHDARRRARRGCGWPWRPCRVCRRWPASIPPSTPPCPMRRPPTPFRRRGGSAGASGDSASTGCPTCGHRRARRADRRGSRRVTGGHLPSRCGASACAVRDGCSIDTTMGFTPAEGLVMATRSGNVDPGLICG